MKSFFTVLFVFYFFSNSFGQNPDILTYDISLDFTDFQKKELVGKTKLTLSTNSEEFKIQLTESLLIDSILLSDKPLDFERNGHDVLIKSNKTDTLGITIYYHGKPAKDEQWGGFFITSDYAYNYGVGMGANPPVFGRSWFPCHDTFTDKALFTFHITTPKEMEAAGCGTLTAVTETENSKTYHWNLSAPIPTYLASIAVGDYDIIEKKYTGIENEIPAMFFVEAGSATQGEKAIECVEYAFHAFEKYFGPYKWEKVGFVSTPFSSGAMEHATNIAFPSYCVEKGCDYLLIHELAHNWFGNLVTCRTEGDMWINEGWASYLESLYEEYRFGIGAAKKYRRQNHRNVLTHTHIRDKGYRALYNPPHKYTYGSTVYDKGADVVHTLRGYLGDSLFFPALKQFFVQNAYGNISTSEFCNFLEKETNTDLTPFFKTWVYSQGFPHFSVKSLETKSSGTKFKTNVVVSQRLHHLPEYANDNKIEIEFIGENWEREKRIIEFSGSEVSQKYKLNFKPVSVFIDPDEKITDATIDEIYTVNQSGEYYFEECRALLDTKSIKDSALIRIEYNVLPPLGANKKNRLSEKEYWKIDGLDFSNIEGEIFLILSDETIKKPVLFYRPNQEETWTSLNLEAQKMNPYLVFVIKNIKAGEYAAGSFSK